MTGHVAPRRPPLTVGLFVTLVVAVLLALLVVHGVDGWLIGGGSVLLIASYGLVRAAWIAWIFLAVVTVGDSVVAATAGPHWWALILNLTLLALLLAPSTRQYIAWPRSESGSSEGPDAVR